LAEFPALPLWTDAYLADTIHLTNRESGAYLHLLIASWRIADGGLPDDHRLLARYAKCTSQEWLRVRDAVLPFFRKDSDGKLRQKRLEKERAFVRQRSEVNRANANAKWLKSKETDHAVASLAHMRNGCENDAPTPTPTPTNKREEKNGGVKSVNGAEGPPMPRHGATGKGHTYIHQGTTEWEAYASDWERKHFEKPKPDRHGGKWFKTAGEIQ
jgi:uncharacterized protein YdaU (DUF1376 family)